MDENDFSKFGQSICDTVTDAVNSAMESMDFSRLSEKISSTADHIMQETVGAFTGKNGQGNKKRNVYEKTDKEKLELRFTKKTPGKVSGILMCTFGGIGTAGFGLPAFILLVLGLIGRQPLVTSCGFLGFLPFAIAFGILLKNGCDRLGRISRFERYKRCIGTKALCAVRSLSGAVGLPEKKVQKELERMILQGYFLQGHMDDEKSCLILDDETYELYLHSKQQMENARREEEQQAGNKEVKEAVRVGMEYIKQIRQINDELPQPVISEKLSHLEDVIGLIYLSVQKTPEKIGSIKRFTEYYLPNTMSLVTRYRDLDRIDTDKARESKAQIENALDTINDAFDKLLDSLYEDDRMKIQTDIAVLKTLLSQEGLVDDGLHM